MVAVVMERLLTAKQVADLLAVDESWVRSATREGRMPHIELGRYKRYRESDVLAWVESCSKPGRVVPLRRDVA
jgi:excisionase family DNA binding protein